MIIAINTRFLLKRQMEGVGRFIYEISKRLVEMCPKDEFHFLFDRKYDPEFIYAPNVKAKVLRPQARSPLLWQYWFEVAVKNYLKKINADVFFSPDTYLSLRSDVPTLLVSHDIAYAHFPEHIPSSALRYYRKYFPKYHRRADHIIAVSNFTKQDIIREYKLDPSKVTVAYNAAPDYFRKLSLEEMDSVKARFTGGDPYFVYAGSIHPRKNILRLIQAFEWFKKGSDHAHKLILTGRMAWNTREIQTAHQQSDNREDILFLDHVEDGLEKIMGAADALVYVSLHEGFGIPVLEAMHCDVPVICANRTSLPEVAGEAAIFVNPKDLSEIANAMQAVVENQELRNRLITEGQKQREKFSWDRSAEIISKALNSLV